MLTMWPHEAAGTSASSKDVLSQILPSVVALKIDRSIDPIDPSIHQFDVVVGGCRHCGCVIGALCVCVWYRLGACDASP